MFLSQDEFPEYVQPSGAVEYSKLDNGLRIASVDRGGLVSSLGLFVNTGRLILFALFLLVKSSVDFFFVSLLCVRF